MNGNTENGKKIAVVTGAYIIAKAVLNGLIGGISIFDIGLSLVMFGLLFGGIAFCNYIVAAILAFGVLKNFGYNISHLPSSLIYLIEALVDVISAVLLVFNKDVKEFFGTKTSNK